MINFEDVDFTLQGKNDENHNFCQNLSTKQRIDSYDAKHMGSIQNNPLCLKLQNRRDPLGLLLDFFLFRFYEHDAMRKF